MLLARLSPACWRAMHCTRAAGPGTPALRAAAHPPPPAPTIQPKPCLRERLAPPRASGASSPSQQPSPPRVATVGDIVTYHYTCKDLDGKVLDDSRTSSDPITFEVGASEVVGNKLFEAFDVAVRGMEVGQVAEFEAAGGEWNPELMFSVPSDHPEVQRLKGRWEKAGGLQKNMLVELANGSMAVVVEVDEKAVKLDCNNMMAGRQLVFELELINIERPEQ